MNRMKLLVLEDVSAEEAQNLSDMLQGDENLSAFFEDPYLDEVLEPAFEEEVWVTYH